jgi:hypothetical protein
LTPPIRSGDCLRVGGHVDEKALWSDRGDFRLGYIQVSRVAGKEGDGRWVDRVTFSVETSNGLHGGFDATSVEDAQDRLNHCTGIRTRVTFDSGATIEGDLR